MIALFIDTNVLLHFQTFDEVDWTKLAGEGCELQIAPIVIDELDKHKNNQNNKIAQRARMIAGKLEKLMDGEQGKVGVNFIVYRPPAEYFENHQLDPKQQDDCLLASILQYQTAKPNVTVKLVSEDLGIKLKGKTLGIVVLKPGKELRLPDTPDKNQKEIERLQKQVATLQERIPKVSIGFENRVVHFHKEVKTNVKTLEEYQAEEMAKLKREHPLMQLIDPNTKTNSPFDLISGLGGILGLSNERREEFNKDLNKYYQDYSLFITKQYAYVMSRLRSFSLTFYLFNDGSIPATDIDVWLHLPDGFTVTKGYNDEPEKPKPPYRPKNNYDSEPMNMRMPNLYESIRGVNQAPRINPDKPTIRKTNSYEVTYHSASLKHGLQQEFDSIIVQYESFEAMKNFTVDYKLHINNIPAPIEGKLHVVIKKTN
jgi:rRNA-processing protein FCF1